MAEQWRALSRPLRILISSVVAFFAAIATVSAGITLIEPWVPAHRQLLRDSIEAQAVKTKEALDTHAASLKREIAPAKIGVYDIQIGIAQARRSTINDQIFAAEIQAPKSDSAEELLKRRQQLQKLRDELTDVESSIRVLRDHRERN